MVEFPDGYALFIHHKIQKDTTIRDDYYLYGSTRIGGSKFRSINEFIPHVEWLQNTNLPFDSHAETCSCKYGNGKEAPSQLPSSTQKRPANSKSQDSNKKSKPEEPDEMYDTVTVERAIDYRSQRRYREWTCVLRQAQRG